MRMLAAIVLAITPFAVTAAEPENPYKNAKVGDTLTYKVTVKEGDVNLESTGVWTVTEKTEKQVTVKTVATILGKEQPAKETKIDLTKEYAPTGKFQKHKDGTERLKFGDKEYDCTWQSYKFEPGANAPERFAVQSELKFWFSKGVPGFVKMNSSTKATNNETNVTMELTEFKAGK